MCLCPSAFASWWNTSHSMCRGQSQTKRPRVPEEAKNGSKILDPALFTSRLILYEKYIP